MSYLLNMFFVAIKLDMVWRPLHVLIIWRCKFHIDNNRDIEGSYWVIGILVCTHLNVNCCHICDERDFIKVSKQETATVLQNKMLCQCQCQCQWQWPVMLEEIRSNAQCQQCQRHCQWWNSVQGYLKFMALLRLLWYGMISRHSYGHVLAYMQSMLHAGWYVVITIMGLVYH